MAKFTFGDAVTVKNSAPEEFRPGQVGAICGFNEHSSTTIYTVEYRDGSDKEIAEEHLQLYEFEDYEFNQENFVDWPLHDATIENVKVDLAQKSLTFELYVLYNPDLEALFSKIIFFDVKNIHITMENPWGSSRFVSIVGQRKEAEVFVLELHTGDEIKVHAKWAILEKVLKV